MSKCLIGAYFCFSVPFPCCLFFIDEDLNYDHLALGLKIALQNDKSAFDADRLQKYTGILFLGSLLFGIEYFPGYAEVFSRRQLKHANLIIVIRL